MIVSVEKFGLAPASVNSSSFSQEWNKLEAKIMKNRCLIIVFGRIRLQIYGLPVYRQGTILTDIFITYCLA